MAGLFCCLVLLFVVAISKGGLAASEAATECVVLLHGLGRTSGSMEDMARGLSKSGYYVVNMDYPSRDETIENLAMGTIPEAIGRCAEKGALKNHFVTHSMGGILLRYYLSRHSADRLGRVVMLSPPNKGSEVSDSLKDWPLYQWYNGPAGQQLGTDAESLAIQLGPVTYPVGVITGDSPAFFDFWLEDMIPGPSDGKVSVERAKVDGMTDFLVLPFSHTYIMQEDEVIRQTIHFLETGQFYQSQ
jgi:pimeloyl-ACP methyl ester carboxylesterase